MCIRDRCSNDPRIDGPCTHESSRTHLANLKEVSGEKPQKQTNTLGVIRTISWVASLAFLGVLARCQAINYKTFQVLRLAAWTLHQQHADAKNVSKLLLRTESVETRAVPHNSPKIKQRMLKQRSAVFTAATSTRLPML
eukprot:6468213-Amphidinium_carterae.1